MIEPLPDVWEMIKFYIDSRKSMNSLEQALNIQSLPGNYDHSPYMYGLMNGMLFAKACMLNTVPEYMTRPEKWGEDNHSSEDNVIGSEDG